MWGKLKIDNSTNNGTVWIFSAAVCVEDTNTGFSLGILFHGTHVPMVFYFEGN